MTRLSHLLNMEDIASRAVEQKRGKIVVVLKIELAEFIRVPGVVDLRSI